MWTQNILKMQGFQPDISQTGGIQRIREPKTYNLAKGFYELVVKGDCIQTTAKIAEMSKLTENAFRDVNIAFANEISLICNEYNFLKDYLDFLLLLNNHYKTL